jgi:ABC-2 type transport system ATP-binding protein
MIPAIQVNQVTKRYGDFCALDNVDLEVAQGEFFGLLGPNGAGKTTLISIIAGLARASVGRALGVVPPDLEEVFVHIMQKA